MTILKMLLILLSILAFLETVHAENAGSKIWVPPIKAKITASSEWNTRYAPGKILKQEGYWAAASGKKAGWLKFSFSSSTRVHGFRIKAPDRNNYGKHLLKDWKLQTSTTGQEGDWTTPTGWTGEAAKKECCEWQEFWFEEPLDAKFKFFRLKIDNNQGGKYLTLGELQFGFDLVDAPEWVTQLLNTYKTTAKNQKNFESIQKLLRKMVDYDLIRDDTDLGIADEVSEREEIDEYGLPNNPLALLTGNDFKTVKPDESTIEINGTVTYKIGNKYFYRAQLRQTGMYAEPGKVVTVTISENMVNKIEVYIGNARDPSQMDFGIMKRSTLKIGSPWGGLIMFYMDEYRKTDEFEATIKNAVKAPMFVLGETTNEEWKTIRKYSPPWSVLRVPGLLQVNIQTLVVNEVDDMEDVMAKWKRTMSEIHELDGVAPNQQPGEETLKFECTTGCISSIGYHVIGGGMSWMRNYLREYLSTSFVNRDSKWCRVMRNEKECSYPIGTEHVILHEIGHGGGYPHLLGDYGQAWADLTSEYIHKTRGLDWLNRWPMDIWRFELLKGMVNFARTKTETNCFELEDEIEDCEEWVYRVPLFEFGFDTLKKVVSVYNKRSLEKGETKTDMFVELFCKKTNTNLLPFFSWYNLNVSKKVKDICEQLDPPPKITKWLAMAECVKQSMESFGAKDIMECAKMPMFPYDENKDCNHATCFQCQFPFKYKGKNYTQCTDVNAKDFWCATHVTSDGSYKDWEYCSNCGEPGLCTISGQCGKDTLTNQLDLDGAPTEEKNTAKNKARCLGRAREYFNKCEGDSTITATFETRAGVKTSETWPPEKTEVCNGQDDGCCTEDTPCIEGEGDCDNNDECLGSLICGDDNCPWGDRDDCCVAPEAAEPENVNNVD